MLGFKVEVMGGMGVDEGKMCEMKRGEGKRLS